MNDHLITISGGLASLLIIIALMLPPDQFIKSNDSRPTTTDRGIYGLMGLKNWLDQNQIPIISLRRRYTSLLIDTRLQESGNILVISIPQITEPSRTELQALEDWTAQGNFILLLSAVADQPTWSLAGNNDLDSLPQALGLRFLFESRETDSDDTGKQQDSTSINLDKAYSILLGKTREPVTLTPANRHPLLENIDSISSFRSIVPDTYISLEGISGARQFLPLLQLGASQETAIWEFRAGSGGGWISTHPDLFGNVTLGQTDNARLFATALVHRMGEGGHVIFDDMHFGVSDLYDPDTFFRDSRLHNTLLFIGIFWLIYLFGYNNRLAPPTKKGGNPRARDFVEAMAGFFARRINSSAAGRGLLDHFYGELRNIYRITDPQKTVLGLLRNNSKVLESDIHTLEQMESRIDSNRKVNLIRLTRTIDRIKGTLQ